MKFYIFLFLIILSPGAFAYLDPGTGSMLIQIVIGVIAGSLMWLKLSWGKVKNFFYKENKNVESEKSKE